MYYQTYIPYSYHLLFHNQTFVGAMYKWSAEGCCEDSTIALDYRCYQLAMMTIAAGWCYLLLPNREVYLANDQPFSSFGLDF